MRLALFAISVVVAGSAVSAAPPVAARDAPAVPAAPVTAGQLGSWVARAPHQSPDAATYLAQLPATRRTSVEEPVRRTDAVFLVNSTADGADAQPGDGVCAVPQNQGGGCTLRAAIGEADRSGVATTVDFLVSRIAPTTALPAVTVPVVIDGGTNGVQITGAADAFDDTPGLQILGGGSTLTHLTVDGFHAIGIQLAGVGSDVVTACRVGTDPSGTSAVANGSARATDAGIEVINTGSRVGGTTAAQANLISGNDAPGILVSSGAHGTVVEGNRLGLDAAGTGSLPNSHGVVTTYFLEDGASTAATDTLVGGITAGAANTVAYNRVGVDVLAPSTTVLGNTVGLDVNGHAAGNTTGVWLSNATDAVVGQPGSGNVISGNTGTGLYLDGGRTTGTQIQANRIGTDAAGNTARPNGAAGVRLAKAAPTQPAGYPSRVTVGGSDPADANVVSGNTGAGVVLAGPGGADQVLGNRIGVNADGTKALHNHDDGVQVVDSPNDAIGGDGTTDGNLIATDHDGVDLDGAMTTGTRVQGNHIGIGLHNEKLGIGHDGVYVEHGATKDVIGYAIGDFLGPTCRRLCNTISNAGADGVAVDSTASTITIRGDAVFRNADLAIALLNKANSDAEPLPNDEDDEDGGANTGLNWPAVVVSTDVPNTTDEQITGQLVMPAAQRAGAVVDIYGLTTADVASDPQPLGQYDSWGEARTHLATVLPASDGSFVATLPKAGLTPYASFSATVTDAAGDTSEVSPICRPLSGRTAEDADDDGICDEWETADGLDYDGDGTQDLNLSAYGADPTRRDLFVELDYFPDRKPQPAALNTVQKAFANAPVTDPLGVGGIALHYGTTVGGPAANEQIPEDTYQFLSDADYQTIRDGTTGDPCDRAHPGHFGSVADRRSPSCWKILGAKAAVWRYFLFGDASDDGSSGSAAIGGRGGSVTIGSWIDDSRRWKNTTIPEELAAAGGYATNACADQTACLVNAQAGTFMHELGHSLGLQHGGDVDINDKPNYLSVMNYLYQVQNLVKHPVTFSHGSLLPMNERALDENQAPGRGTTDDDHPGWTNLAFRTRVLTNGRQTCEYFAAGINQSPVDWNNDGNATENPSTPPNAFTADPKTAPAGCWDAQYLQPAPLADVDDWALLRYSPVPDSGIVNPGEAEVDDADPAGQDHQADSDGDGVTNDVDDCPQVANAGQQDSDHDGIGDACVSAITDRDLTVTASHTGAVVAGESTRVTVSATNAYPRAATGDVVSVPVPTGFSLVSASASSGTYTSSNGTWSVPSIAARSTVTLTLTLKPSTTAPLPTTLIAELTSAGQPDPTSTPGNHDPSEDDEALLTLGKSPADLSLAAQLQPNPVAPGKPATLTFTLADASPSDAGPTNVTITPPTGLTLAETSASAGTYAASTGVWSVPTVPAHGARTLTFSAKSASSGGYPVRGEVTTAWSPDPDSTPGNHVPTEDDQTQVTLQVGSGSTADPGDLDAVSCASTAFCVAVGAQPGNGGPLIAVRSNGVWSTSPVTGPAGSFGLNGVSCASATSCVAVGDAGGGSAYSLIYDGSSWRAVPIPLASGGTSLGLSGISCTSSTQCLAVGTGGRSSYPSIDPVSARWNGTAWTTTAMVPADDGAYMYSVSCAGATACTAVGQYATDEQGTPPHPDIQTWNGTRWTLATPATTAHFAGILSSVSCSTSTTCLAGGEVDAGGSLAEAGSGSTSASTWTLTSPAGLDPSASLLTGVSCPTTTWCLTVGETSDTTEHPVAASRSGATWQVLDPVDPTGASSRFTAVSCVSTTYCVGVGYVVATSGSHNTTAQLWNGASWGLETP